MIWNYYITTKHIKQDNQKMTLWDLDLEQSAFV